MGVELSHWLLNLDFDRLIGFEEEEEEEEEEETEEEEEEEEETEEEDEGEKSKKSKSKAKEEEDRTAGLKSALRKERQSRRQLAKELKELKAKLPDPKKDEADKDKADKERETAAQRAQAEKDREKSEKLAAKLLVNAVDTTIVKVMQDTKMPKFRDSDDVLRLINRADIDVDQDDDDPSQVTVDEDDVRDALKALSKAKPHLLADKKESGEGGGKTGSKFGKKKTTEQMSAERRQLTQKYPALARKR